MKLSLAMIVKGTAEEADYLNNALKSTEGIFNEIVIVANTPEGVDVDPSIETVCAEHRAKCINATWQEDFSEMRNLSFAQCTGDLIFWMDADDTIDNPLKLRALADNLEPYIDAVFLDYLYEVDEYGAVKVNHWRERLIRNNGAFTWKGRLHETLIENRGANKVKNMEVKIIHHSQEDRRDQAIERNTRILQKQLEDEGKNPDPRTMFYLAACYMDLGAYEDAEHLYTMYLKLSGWDEERSQAWCQIAQIYRKQERQSEAMDAYLNAIKEDPDNREPYTSIAEMYYLDEKFEKAVTWVEMGMQRPEKESMTVQNPLNVTYRPLLIYAEAQFHLGKIDQAIKAVKKAQAIRNDELVKEMYETFNKVKGHQLAAQAIADVARFLDLEGEKKKAKKMFNEIIPESLKDNPYLLNMRRKFFKPKKWPEKSVVIFTGNCVIGNWGPWSLKEGIGGSEEAIIRLSKRLTEQGYSVTVYSMPGDKGGVHDGVDWKNYWEFDGRDEFDVLIGWRNPFFFDNNYNARKKYLWLHDVMPEGEFTEQRLNNIDKVLVLSKYHRSLFPSIPDNKIWLSANGIDAEEFDGSETHERNPHKIIFASSHVRGLPHLLEIWPDVKKAVPKAELHFFYGRQSFVAVHKENPERLAWLEDLEKKMEELPDVYDRGKVSQAVIAEETMSSGIWAYPCPFPEISCITAMKSQAGGAVPVASNFAALNETIQYGVKMPMLDDDGVGVWNKKIAKEYKAALIDMLKNTDKQDRIRKEMIPWAKQNFSWTKVATDWIEEFEK